MQGRQSHFPAAGFFPGPPGQTGFVRELTLIGSQGLAGSLCQFETDFTTSLLQESQAVSQLLGFSV